MTSGSKHLTDPEDILPLLTASINNGTFKQLQEELLRQAGPAVKQLQPDAAYGIVWALIERGLCCLDFCAEVPSFLQFTAKQVKAAMELCMSRQQYGSLRIVLCVPAANQLWGTRVCLSSASSWWRHGAGSQKTLASQMPYRPPLASVLHTSWGRRSACSC